ncbi:hypothetical protein HYPSUDRAFT_202805 [Hypholoma sublateritium FD-334 SS-4]|uniref:Uncharacterized protein n=1 Tax=Hypholoma sublateritium (strain FD-334 SS-4) TaxID=945553 RepID=A0A0D2NSA6_HYPSF|nr:hypothetical protein HYPSUDRAFT_202805 [Hypholoma sublateritium FD-334 SS-4]
MDEQFSMIFFYLRMFYISDHYCCHTAADLEAFDQDHLECIGDETTRMHMRLTIAGLVFEHQQELREYLQVADSEALVLYKFVVSADLHSTLDDPALHWTIRLYNARDVQVATMHVYANDDRKLTIEVKASYREFVYEDEESGKKMYCFRHGKLHKRGCGLCDEAQLRERQASNTEYVARPSTIRTLFNFFVAHAGEALCGQDDCARGPAWALPSEREQPAQPIQEPQTHPSLVVHGGIGPL